MHQNFALLVIPLPENCPYDLRDFLIKHLAAKRDPFKDTSILYVGNFFPSYKCSVIPFNIQLLITEKY